MGRNASVGLVMLALSLFVGACEAVAQVPDGSVLYLVRHADKENDSKDSPLSKAGLERADALRDKLKDAGITGIVISTRQRTRQTAAPLALARGLTPVPASHNAVAAIRKFFPGKVLVVGHTDTVPSLIRAFGGPKVAIPLDDYDNLFAIHGKAKGATFSRDLYGAPSP